jgi:hypothetical protein
MYCTRASPFFSTETNFFSLYFQQDLPLVFPESPQPLLNENRKENDGRIKNENIT